MQTVFSFQGSSLFIQRVERLQQDVVELFFFFKVTLGQPRLGLLYQCKIRH